MNNKIFIRIGILFVITIFLYLSFVLFFLSPKVNSYLAEIEVNNTKINFDRMVSIVDFKSKDSTSKENFLKDIEILIKNFTLSKTGYIYLISKENGEILFDPSGELNTYKKLEDSFFEKIKSSYDKKETFTYNWNKLSDLNNFTYKKISWIAYNEKFDFYLVSSIYEEEFSTLFDGINFLILETSIALFIVLVIIGIFITVKIIVPFNKISNEIKEVDDISSNEANTLVSQVNKLVTHVKTSKERLEEQIQIKTKELESRLYYDDLTNLKNRYALEDDIKDIDFVSITLLDIDSFDDINELYGFSIGNLVLIEVAKILSDFGSNYNVAVYRIYGNVYCLADNKMMGFSKYSDFIEELGKLFKNSPIYIDELDIDIFINITLGISIAQENPIKTASIALKRAKKNNMPFFVYNNEIDTKDIIQKSIYWREKIKNAIEFDNVLPFYQAIFDKNKNIVKYETLMRIRDKNENEEINYISPNLFLDVSVKTKQYLQLSYKVISKALEDLIKIDKQISINLSFKDILDNEFINSLDNSLSKIKSKDKERIVFEILESDYISDYSLLEDFIIKYRNQGIKIAIDDFGTGYSNF